MEICPQTTILLVDDQLMYLGSLIDAFADVGFKVFLGETGEEALSQAEAIRPGIVLLDIMMPGMDGFETCRRLKANSATRDIPVLFMTALNDPVNKVQGFEIGGADYVTKPLHHAEVIARVNVHVTLRRQQQELLHQRAELVELNARKNKFISIVSHDLRSPLTGFAMVADLFHERLAAHDYDGLEQIAAQLQTSIKQVLTSLQNLLTWSRMQQNVIECAPQQLDLHTLAAYNINLLRPHAEYKQLHFVNAIPKPLHVLADLAMLESVVRNLLSNAVKFTKPGGRIEISAARADGAVTVKVIDSGIGIAAEHRSKLFRIDGKYQRPGTDKEQGSGLGLILCKEFVEKHGGRIWVESTLAQGTTFAFTLPDEAPQQDAPASV